jgi:hypothetical protein
MSPRLLRPRASGASAIFATDADARAYIAAVNAADRQPLEQATQLAIDAFVIGCKADGIFAAIKACCILMGARTLSGCLTPLVGSAPTNNNFVTGDYNRKTGLVGDGTGKYLDSNRNNNADPQNSVSHAVWVSTSSTGSVPIGAGFNLTGATRCAIIASPATISVRIRSSAAFSPAATGNPSNNSLFAYRRSASNASLVRVNGTDTTYTTSSETPFNGNVLVFADNNSGSATAWFAGRLAFYSIGQSMDLALLDTRVSTLIAAIGAAIP